MQYFLAYGKTTLPVELPEKNVVKVLHLQPGTPLDEPENVVRQKLSVPNGAAPLADIAAGKHSACIVISDITRPVPNKVILPPILETLEQA
ncbi:MAG: lactate racemase domain-containing protein, partial [Planctomycetaceae bacterium]|nr:lactate racemase domain-containing protein [Planctomycetaceae bacterium]